MTARRGDVVLAWYTFASGVGGRWRPCLVVSAGRDGMRRTPGWRGVSQIPSDRANCHPNRVASPTLATTGA